MTTATTIEDQQVIGDAIDTLLLREVADGQPRTSLILQLEATVPDHAAGRCLTDVRGDCLALVAARRILAGEEL
ncbi:hypothetical protein [Pseudonocardia pini]|uniref:hypothetical protein n=1 Tax=Pseudonocardia pini TaxID=2758030 RepID=UPI0015F0744A|nr:hypothetical protein [Pseudonocardia pini]